MYLGSALNLVCNTSLWRKHFAAFCGKINIIRGALGGVSRQERLKAR